MINFGCALIVLLAFQAVAFAALEAPASKCDVKACDISKNCRCSSSPSPLSGNLTDWPQLVSLTFDDSITQRVYDEVIYPLLFDKVNPGKNGKDGSPISGTFFVPHEFTNYQMVNTLFGYGFEIGVNSISKNPFQDYWRNASETLLVQEFQGQRKIISKFANIPEKEIVGVRTPQLALAGDKSIKAYVTAGLTYDSSWPALNTQRLFPYTLDYLSTESCLLGGDCPTEAYPGFWILPINDLTGKNNNDCNSLSGCNMDGTADEIANWLTDQLESIRNSTRVPLTMMFGLGWFNSTDNSAEAFNKFISTAVAKKDVFFVNQRQVLEFIKSPVKLASYTGEWKVSPTSCNQRTCKVKNGTLDVTFDICGSCPSVYPWLGNPGGDPVVNIVNLIK